MTRLTPDQLASRVRVFDVDQLDLWEENPNRADMAALERSVSEFGQIDTILVDGTLVRDGNHRVKLERATRQFGGKLAGIDITGLDWSDARAAAAGLGLNITARLGADDPQALTQFLQRIADEDQALLRALSYNDDLTPMVTGDLPPWGAGGGPGGSDDSEPPPAGPPPADPVTRPGDLWLLGPHRVLCGDSRDPNHVAALLDGAAINLAVTSPPYADRRTYDETSGFRPIPPDDYVQWFEAVQANVAAHLAPDGSWFVNIKPSPTDDGEAVELYVYDLVLAHARQWGWKLATEFCWERTGFPGPVTRRFKNQFEPIYQFVRGPWKIRPENVATPTDKPAYSDGRQLSEIQGARDAYRPSYVSDRGLIFPGNRLPTFGGTHEAVGHNAAYPVGLPAFFCRAYTDLGDTVYDPFLGSGSTLLAAHQHQRIGYGIEISPGYVDTILQRWQRHTGIQPILAATGQAHDFPTPEDE